ncbi:SNF2-related protein [Pseudomonas aeruginosa]|nr:SNF2-related protein [Pseudomonas aeruginosa]
MRNEETGAWRTGSLLRDVSTHQLMLSATPINLGSDDLFNLLRLLDPDHFEYPEDFRNVVLANRPVIAASDVVRDPTSDTDQIMAAIHEIESSRWFERSERVDRLIEEAESIKDWTNDRRIDIAAKLERLNLLAHIVSRTRKREVQSDRVLRDVTVFEAEMSPVERELYQAITEGTREYALANGIEHGFLLSTPQRMVASSPAALLRTWRDDGLDADALAVAMDEVDEDEEKLAERTSGLKRWLASRTLPQFGFADLSRNDSKFAELSKAFKRFVAEDREAKAIVFTTFRGHGALSRRAAFRRECGGRIADGRRGVRQRKPWSPLSARTGTVVYWSARTLPPKAWIYSSAVSSSITTCRGTRCASSSGLGVSIASVKCPNASWCGTSSTRTRSMRSSLRGWPSASVFSRALWAKRRKSSVKSANSKTSCCRGT